MEGCVTLPLDEKQLQGLVIEAKDHLVTHGLVLRTVESPNNGDVVMHAPVTLMPSPVPRNLYDQAQRVQTDINLMMHKIAHDYHFLRECLQEVIKVDDFTRRLWEIYDTVTQEGVLQALYSTKRQYQCINMWQFLEWQPYSLGLHRSDYMFDCGTPASKIIASGTRVNTDSIKLRMIEVNLMAASFGGLSQQLKGHHKFMLERLGLYDEVKKVPQPPEGTGAADTLAKGMLAAWECYQNTSAVVMFLVLSPERNVYDQRHLEYSLYTMNPKVKVIYMTLTDLRERGQLNKDGCLTIDGYEVAVVYQRSLYMPEHYTSSQDWDTRLLLERSRAIKCPSACYHLANTKKVQQVLSKPGVIEKFVSDPEAISRIRDTFAGQYSLDLDEEGDKAVASAMKNPDLFVLKPQREGGGNNTYGEEIRTKLAEIQTSTERTAYILMDHIHPYPIQNYLVRSGKPTTLHHCVSELGIYGAFVGTADSVKLNITGGSCLRTKTVGTNEGGVATGFSCLDSPYLV